MKVIVTGVTGYLGSILIRKLLQDPKIEQVTGIDIKEPNFSYKKFNFIQLDIRDTNLAVAIAGCDTAVHLAFIVQEIRDKKLTYDINVNGTKNFLEACRKNKIRKIVVASSIAAYGSVPRNSVITEDTPLNGNNRSYYSYTKMMVEKMLDEFEKNNPNILITRLRPSVLIGKNINNPFKQIVNLKTLYYIKGNDKLPVVYESDVADAFYKVTIEEHPGAYNIHAGNLSLQWVADKLGIRTKAIPYYIARIVIDIAFLLGASPFSSHWVELARYPFELSTDKAKKELGWTPTKTPEEAFMEMIDSIKGGKL